MRHADILLNAVFALFTTKAKLVVSVEFVCEPEGLCANAIVHHALLCGGTRSRPRLVQRLRMREGRLRGPSSLESLTCV